jgi:hypothetical protein
MADFSRRGSMSADRQLPSEPSLDLILEIVEMNVQPLLQAIKDARES